MKASIFTSLTAFLMVVVLIAGTTPGAAGIHPSSSPSPTLSPSLTLSLAATPYPYASPSPTKYVPPLASPSVSASDSLADGPEVLELLLCEDVVDREPVNAGMEFTTGTERIYAFARISNPDQETELHFRWTHNEALYAQITVEVGVSEGWRTWTSVLSMAGDWQVELISNENETLASTRFTVVPGD
jgi:hypothetical protein